MKGLPVFVTLDPERDNPSHLRAYLKGPNSSTAQFVILYSNCLYTDGLVNISFWLPHPPHSKFSWTEFDSRIVGLTGPVSAIRQIAQEYRAYFKKVEEDGDDYLVESSHNM